jgi:hypothetical protein
VTVESRITSLELAITNLARLVFDERDSSIAYGLSATEFVSGAGDDATPVDLIVGNRIQTPNHGPAQVTANSNNANGDLLSAELRHLYTGHTQLLDPSEDPTASVSMDTDVARQTGVPSLSGQGPEYRPRIDNTRAGNTSWQPGTDTQDDAKKSFIPPATATE